MSDNVFAGLDNAKALGGFTSRLGVGNHTVLLKRLNVKDSAKGKGKIVEADLYVVESNTHAQGETRGWAWFIGMPGFAGDYEASRLKAFFETVGRCIGDTRPASAIGPDLAGPGQAGRGIMLKAIISHQTNKDGSVKAGKDGVAYTQITWEHVNQGLEDIKKHREILDGMPTVAAPAAQATVAQTTIAAQTATSAAASTGQGVSSLLASLKK